MPMETKDGESHAAHVEMMLPGWSRRLREQTDPTPVAPPARLPRITRLMALAIKFQDMVDRGGVRDYADIARLGYVTRARVTQIMNLLNLAPEIQEYLLSLDGSTERGCAITERDLRTITSLPSWADQRKIMARF